MPVTRDRFGIPHVRAESVLDLAFAQGRVTALDRPGQLRDQHCRSRGRLAEHYGVAALEWDRFARRIQIDDTARRAAAALGDETAAFVAAYVAGVNSVLDADDSWEPHTPLAVFLTQQILFANFPGKLFAQHVIEVAGAEVWAALRREGEPAGSNAFAVGADRTSSGRPIIAGDPHRTFERPNVYAQIRLSCPEFDVSGFAFPGVPGVQHFGHAGEVAWAVTNAMADYQDVYSETLERRAGGVWAEGPAGREPVHREVETIAVRDHEPVEVEILVTGRGPVVAESDAASYSVRTASWVLGDLGFEALLPLLRARTTADVESALAHWVEPVNNFLVADRSGALVHRVAGRVPRRPASLWHGAGDARSGHQWDGWVTLPRRTTDADGFLVTANDRATPEFGVLGDTFAAPFRARRIADLLEQSPAIDPAQAAGVLLDVRQLAGDPLLALVGTAPPGAERDRLLGWDREMTADSLDAGLYADLRDAVVAGIVADPRFDDLRSCPPWAQLYAAWFALAPRVAGSLPLLLGPDNPLRLDRQALVDRALAGLADQTGRGRPWGERHVYAGLDTAQSLGLPAAAPAPATPLSGDNECVRVAGSLPGSTGSVRGSVARYVWVVGDPESSAWSVPLGAGEDDTDQHADWVAGRLAPLRSPGRA